MLYMHINIYVVDIYIYNQLNGQKSSKKGLASASKKTKTKVARKSVTEYRLLLFSY